MQRLPGGSQEKTTNMKVFQDELPGVQETEQTAITVSNLDGEFVYVNNKAADLYGYTKEELLDLEPYELIAELNPDEVNKITSIWNEEINYVDHEIITGDGKRATIKANVDIIEIGGKKYILAETEDLEIVEDVNESASKQVDQSVFKDITKERLEQITKNIRVDAPGGKMTLNAIMIDLLAGHNEIEQYKKGALSLYDALDERLAEEEKRNPDSKEVAVLKEIKRSAFGLYLRIQRGDEELHGNREGKYSGYFD